MTIQEIREAGHPEIADLAELRRKEAGRPFTGLGCAFDWLYTKEYHTFWMYVCDGEFEQAYQIVSLEEIKKRIVKKEMKPKKREEIEEICIEVIKKLGLLKPVESVCSKEEEKVSLDENGNCYFQTENSVVNIPIGVPSKCDVINLEEKKVELPTSIDEFYCHFKGSCKTRSFSIKYVDLLHLFDALLVARDVYRQGWKPDWSDLSVKHSIHFYENDSDRHFSTIGVSKIFAFQSKELRNTFYDNFKEELEKVKVLWN